MDMLLVVAQAAEVKQVGILAAFFAVWTVGIAFLHWITGAKGIGTACIGLAAYLFWSCEGAGSSAKTRRADYPSSRGEAQAEVDTPMGHARVRFAQIPFAIALALFGFILVIFL